MAHQKHLKLWIVLGITGIVYILIGWFYPSFMELSCDKGKNVCTYVERNIYGARIQKISVLLSGSDLIMTQHKHHYYTGRRAQKKTTVDYQLEIHNAEVELPIFKASYVQYSTVLEQWKEFKKSSKQPNLSIKNGFCSLLLSVVLLGILWLSELFLCHRKK